MSSGAGDYDLCEVVPMHRPQHLVRLVVAGLLAAGLVTATATTVTSIGGL